MSARTARPAVDLAPPAPARPRLALGLALLSVPGVTIAWDVAPGGGFTTGIPLAIAAIVIGLQARTRLSAPDEAGGYAGATGTRMALSAVAIASLALLSVAVFMAVGPPE
jgi:multisubunit Na+/H+ antiporter MnhB subunit